MINQKFVYSLKKAINLFMVIALVMAGVAVNVSPAQAAAGDIVIIAPAVDAKIHVKDGDSLNVQFTVDSTGKAGSGSYQIKIGSVLAQEAIVYFNGSAAQPFTIPVTIPTMGAANEGLQSVSVAVKLSGETVFGAPKENLNAVIVDNLDPVAPVLNVPNGGEEWAVNTSQTITWAATPAPHADETFTLYFSADNGGHWSKIAADKTGSSYIWTTPLVITTQGLIKIEVVDKAGNTAADQSAAVFTIYGADNTAPTVAMMGLDEFVSGNVTLQATASDTQSGIAGVLFQYSQDEGESWSVAGAGSFVVDKWQLAFDTTSLPDGDVQFRAIATNGAGLSKTSDPAAAAVIDNSDPVILSFNLANGGWVGSGFTFEVTASDAHSDIAKMDVLESEDNGVNWKATAVCSVNATTPDEFDVYTLECKDDDGGGVVLSAATTAIKVKVTNKAGLTAEVSRTVQVDLTAPTVTAGALTAPLDSAKLHLGDPLEIKWTATAITEPHLAGIDLKLLVGTDVKAVIASGEANDGSYTWTVAGEPGTYVMCLVARDLAGNTTSDCKTGITIWGTDTTAPEVTLAPIASPNTTKVKLSATAVDPQSGIQKVEFFVKLAADDDDHYSLVGSDSVAPYSVDWNTATPSTLNGEYMIKAVATNGVGTVAEDIFGPVLIDNKDPEVLTLSRAGNIYKVSASDGAGSGIASVVFEYYSPAPINDWVEIGEGVLNPVSGKYESPAWVDVYDTDVRAIATDNVGLSDAVVYEPDALIELAERWNLISLPLIPDAPAIDDVLTDLIARGSVKQVVAWPFEGDSIHEKRWNGENYLDVTDIVDGVGYWVEMLEPDMLYFDGVFLPEPPLAPPSYIVHRGWNLIGFKSTLENVYTADEYLGEAGGHNMRMMYGFDESTGYYVQIAGTTTPLVPGNGYWLAVSVDATIYPPAK